MRIFVLKKSTLLRAGAFVLLFAAAICVTQLIAVEDAPVMSQSEGAPITTFDTDEKQAAITIDTAFGDDYTAELLTILDDAGVKATFFVMGAWAEENPELVAAIKAGGHELASHSYAHKNYTELTPEQIASDVRAASATLLKTAGVTPTIVRPPYGAYDQFVLETLDSLGVNTVKWSVDSRDWKREGVDVTTANVINNVKPGSVIMFQNNIIDTPMALKQSIAKLTEDGYSFVLLSDVLEPKVAPSPTQQAASDIAALLGTEG